MAVPFPLIGKFTGDAELDRRLLEFQKSVETALRHLDARKEERFFPRTSNHTPEQARFWDLWVMDTSAQALHVILPTLRGNRDSGVQVAVLRTSASFALTVHAVGTTVKGAATHAPATGSLVVYTSDGKEWWSP